MAEVGDFNGDGNADLLWTDTRWTGPVIWEMNGATLAGVGLAGIGASAGQMGAECGTLLLTSAHSNGDGDSGHILGQRSGQAAVWTA